MDFKELHQIEIRIDLDIEIYCFWLWPIYLAGHGPKKEVVFIPT